MRRTGGQKNLRIRTQNDRIDEHNSNLPRDEWSFDLSAPCALPRSIDNYHAENLGMGAVHKCAATIEVA
jgi:hypothetical protein